MPTPPLDGSGPWWPSSYGSGDEPGALNEITPQKVAAAHRRLPAKLRQAMEHVAGGMKNGTCRFGSDADASVLDPHCKAHDLDNLYVIDGSFFPSSSAVNPSLTMIANALRVADHLRERLA